MVQTTYTYGPFGQTASGGQSSDNPYQFVGRENDSFGVPEVPPYSVYNFRARYLDTATGRFASSDPEGFAGGSHGAGGTGDDSGMNGGLHSGRQRFRSGGCGPPEGGY